MKTILLHSDFIEFEAKKKAVKKPEEIELKKHRVEDCLVAMSAVEKNDEADTTGIAEKFVEEVISVA
ncbi:MAG: threonine--tRNA ligase, partial [Candidatus Aenigmarchaeota archaeon]|nr:threonine--tRNA ligase [Candidatus Aenigmarchaeota archaeon]